MLHTWKVYYIDRAGKIHARNLIKSEARDAMRAVRDSIPNIVVVGSVQVSRPCDLEN